MKIETHFNQIEWREKCAHFTSQRVSVEEKKKKKQLLQKIQFMIKEDGEKQQQQLENSVPKHPNDSSYLVYDKIVYASVIYYTENNHS